MVGCGAFVSSGALVVLSKVKSRIVFVWLFRKKLDSLSQFKKSKVYQEVTPTMKKVVKTSDGPPPQAPYSQAIIANGLVFVSGQGLIDP